MLNIKPAETLDFPLPQSVQTSSEAHPASSPVSRPALRPIQPLPQYPDQLWGPSSLIGNGYRRLFPPGGGRLCKMTNHPTPCVKIKLHSDLRLHGIYRLHLHSFSSTAQCSGVPNPSPNPTVIPRNHIHDFAAPIVTPRTPLVHLLFHIPSSCPSCPYFLHYYFWIPCDFFCTENGGSKFLLNVGNYKQDHVA